MDDTQIICSGWRLDLLFLKWTFWTFLSVNEKIARETL